jgi:RNA polymerase sigma factor (TIGR02999 family)
VRNGDQQDITGLLAAWNGGDVRALDRLVDLVYPSLRRIAHQQLGRWRPGESLESAALANEAYLKLVRAGGIRCQNRAHFLALCSQIMRRILVDHARRRRVAKRGGRALTVALDDALLTAQARGIEVLALDEALDALARIDCRKGRVVELRYFGGLNVGETAEILGVSVDTVKRDWRMARAWLFAELAGKHDSARAEARSARKSGGRSAEAGPLFGPLPGRRGRL